MVFYPQNQADIQRYQKQLGDDHADVPTVGAHLVEVDAAERGTIIMSHMGKPKGKVDMKKSLGQIREAVEKALGVPVAFAPDCAKAQEQAKALKMGEALLLENLRFYPEEEGKPVGLEKGTPEFDEATQFLRTDLAPFSI